MRQTNLKLPELLRQAEKLRTELARVEKQVAAINSAKLIVDALGKPGSPFPYSHMRYSASKGQNVLMLCKRRDKVSSAQLNETGPSFAALAFLVEAANATD